MRDKGSTFQNILVIDFGQLGDVVLSLPALAAIRRRFPESRLSVLSGKVPGEVLALSGLADEVIAVDRVELRDGPRLRSIVKVFGIVADIRRRRFDLVIDLHSLSETNILAFLTSGTRLLANRESRSLDRLSNFDPPPPKEDKSKHLTDRYFDVLRPLGIEASERTFRLSAPPEDVRYVDERFFGGRSRPTVGLFPGAGHPSRCWQLDRFAEVAARLEKDGYRPVVFLGPEETELRDRVSELIAVGTLIIDGLSIRQFIAAASRLAAFITNDTGPMHLAACAGAPVLLLLDGRAPDTYLPLTDQLLVVRQPEITAIGVQEVYRAALMLMATPKNDKRPSTC